MKKLIKAITIVSSVIFIPMLFIMESLYGIAFFIASAIELTACVWVLIVALLSSVDLDQNRQIAPVQKEDGSYERKYDGENIDRIQCGRNYHDSGVHKRAL